METTLSQRIASRRKEVGLTREDLAAAAGVSVAAVQAWESGATKNLKLDHLFTVADALNVNPRWLATERGPKVAAPNMEAYSIALGRRDEAKSQERRKGWERIAARFARAALVLVLAIPPLLVPHPAQAAFNIIFNGIHIAKYLLRRSFNRVALFFVKPTTG
jgi:transcriptional regulator with XRE-family HTH domain